MNLKHIFEGWSKHLNITQVSESDRDLATARVFVCLGCKHSKEQWLSKVIDGALKKDVLGSGIGCELCGCPVNQKALVREETCPENKW